MQKSVMKGEIHVLWTVVWATEAAWCNIHNNTNRYTLFQWITSFTFLSSRSPVRVLLASCSSRKVIPANFTKVRQKDTTIQNSLLAVSSHLIMLKSRNPYASLRMSRPMHPKSSSKYGSVYHASLQTPSRLKVSNSTLSCNFSTRPLNHTLPDCKLLRSPKTVLTKSLHIRTFHAGL